VAGAQEDNMAPETALKINRQFDTNFVASL
jgi:hypothetical protein